MKHNNRKNREEKIRQWLELCDVAFELFKGGFGNKYKNEKFVWTKLNRKIQKDMIFKRQSFARLINK